MIFPTLIVIFIDSITINNHVPYNENEQIKTTWIKITLEYVYNASRIDRSDMVQS